jgi:hypothetical protein
MTEIDLQAGLRSLQASLRQVKSLLEWEKLRQSEAKPRQQPAFRMYDPLEADLRNEYSFFLSISIQMHAILQHSKATIPDGLRVDLTNKLAKLDQQVYQLNLHQRNWRC